MEASFLWFVCVAPLRLEGLREKKSTPSVGWEVSMRYHRLARKSWTERNRGTTTLDYVTSVMVGMSNLHL
jgi:hypothetical protein